MKSTMFLFGNWVFVLLLGFFVSCLFVCLVFWFVVFGVFCFFFVCCFVVFFVFLAMGKEQVIKIKW